MTPGDTRPLTALLGGSGPTTRQALAYASEHRWPWWRKVRPSLALLALLSAWGALTVFAVAMEVIR